MHVVILPTVAQMLSYHTPLNERVQAKVPFCQHLGANRPSRYKKWNPESMAIAIEAVQKGECTIRQAAEIYQVPKSTLSDRLSGKVIHGTTSGPQHYLSDIEENNLVKFLCKYASIGSARSKKQVIALVNEIMQKKGKVGTVSSGWWESFRKRHPNLVLEEKRISQQKEVVAVRHENNDDHTQDHEEGSLDREQELDAEASLFEYKSQEGYDEQYNEWVRRFHSYCNDWSMVVRVSPSLDSADSRDVRCLSKILVMDKLLDSRKEEFRLPNLKVKNHLF